jgi:hypothetical protein
MKQPIDPVAQPHSRRRLTQTHAPPRPQLPSDRLLTELEAQQERRTHGARERNLWTTRAENAPLWTACGTPRFRFTHDSGKSYFPHILLRRGHSREQPLCPVDSLLSGVDEHAERMPDPAGENGSDIHRSRQQSTAGRTGVRPGHITLDADRIGRWSSAAGCRNACEPMKLSVDRAERERQGTTGNGPCTSRIDTVDGRGSPSTLADQCRRSGRSHGRAGLPSVGRQGRLGIPRGSDYDALPLAPQCYGPRGTRVGRYVRYRPEEVRAWFDKQGREAG